MAFLGFDSLACSQYWVHMTAKVSTQFSSPTKTILENGSTQAQTFILWSWYQVIWNSAFASTNLSFRLVWSGPSSDMIHSMTGFSGLGALIGCGEAAFLRRASGLWS